MKKFKCNSNYPYQDYYCKFNLIQRSVSFILNKPNLRNILTSALNYEQILLTEDNFLRDYRGLAELLKFSYNEIQNLSKSKDPVLSILTKLDNENKKKKNDVSFTLLTIVNLLEKMQRYDVIDDLLIELQSIENDLDNDVNLNMLRINQLDFSQANTYHAYVCYADSDLPFVHRLSEVLESKSINLKLFIRHRDLLMGSMEYHEFTRLIQKKCNRLLIILSSDFFNSPECDFQTKFTLSLQIHERNRKLIPILYKPCELPIILRFLTKIDLTKKDYFPEWTLRKLVMSLIDNEENFDSDFNIKNNSNLSNKELDSGFISNTSINSQPTSTEINNKIYKQTQDQIKLYHPSLLSTFDSMQLTSFDSQLNNENSILLEKQKNFNLLNRFWKKIGILNKK